MCTTPRRAGVGAGFRGPIAHFFIDLLIAVLLMLALSVAAWARLYWRTRTLWAPIAAHALTNLTACLLLLTGYA